MFSFEIVDIYTFKKSLKAHNFVTNLLISTLANTEHMQYYYFIGNFMNIVVQ